MSIIGLLVILFFVILVFGSVSSYLYKTFSSGSAEILSIKKPFSYRPGLEWFIGLTLLGYNIGLHSALFHETQRVPALGWAVFSVFAGIAWYLYLRSKHSALTYSLIAVSTIAGMLLPARANGFIQSFNVFVQVATSLLLVIISVHTELVFTVSGLLRGLVSLLPFTFVNAIRAVRTVFSREGVAGKSIVGWVKTAVITFIALIVFLSILANADPVFAKIMAEFREQLWGRTIASVGLLLVLASVLAAQISHTDSESSFSWLSYRDIMSAVFAVSIVSAVFLAVQFQYLFLGNRELLTELNLTFSEYVRKGFVELLIAAFIGGLMSYALSIKSRQTEKSKLGKFLNIILILELGLFLVSAWQRDILYVQTYGLTRVRIVGGVFLFWLAAFLAVLGVFSLRPKLSEARLLGVVWIISICAWVGLNAINIDRIVAHGAPEHHEYTDYFYLMQLSEDTIDEQVSYITQDFPESSKQLSMPKELQTLLAKPTLTDIEKAQLAGIKLALLSFMKNRNRLYELYAPEDWLLKNGWRIGQQFEEGALNYRAYPGSVSLNDNVYATNWEQPEKDREIPKYLKVERTWAHYNMAEKRAFAVLKQNEHVAFEPVSQMIRNIREYQVRNQISLFEEEDRLLYKLKYPFMNASLRGYSPEDMRQMDPDNRKHDTYNWDIFYESSKSYHEPSDLLALQCNATVTPIQTIGILRLHGPVVDDGTFLATLEQINDSAISVRIIVAAGVKVENPTQQELRNVSVSRPYGKPEEIAMLEISSISRPVLVIADVSRRPSGPGSCGEYEATKLTELRGL